VNQLFERTPHELPKRLPVTIRERLAGYFLGETGSQSIMIVKARIVISH